MKGQLSPVVLRMCAWHCSCIHRHQPLLFWVHLIIMILLIYLVLLWLGIIFWFHSFEFSQIVSIFNTVSSSLLIKLNSQCFHCLCLYLYKFNLEKNMQSEYTTNCTSACMLQSSLILFSHSQEKASRPICHLRFLLISTYILLTLLTSLRVCKETCIFPFI